MNKVIVAYKRGYRISETGVVVNPKGEEVKGFLSKNYFCFKIRTGKTSSVNIPFHRLQAFQKYGEIMFLDGVDVRHKNGESQDNSFENILIGTKSQNQLDVPESIRVSRAVHASSFIKKHNHEEIRKFHFANSNSYKKTMDKFDISSKGTLSFILNKKIDIELEKS